MTQTQPCQLQPGAVCVVTSAPRDTGVVEYVKSTSPDIALAFAVGIIAIVGFLRFGRWIMRLNNEAHDKAVTAYKATKQASVAIKRAGIMVSR
jgi:hypothetical protein